jgi:tetratricopeptide (TPR) repeat protein
MFRNKSIKNMKALKYSFIIMLVLFINNACNEDHLDLQPLGDTEADIFDEQIDFDRAELAAYAKIADLFVYGGANGDHHSFFLLPGDDITTTNSGEAQSFEIFSTLQPGNGFLNRDYDIIYLLVNRANVLLEKIAMDEEKAESAYNNIAMRDQNKGEALFLRGWAFFFLWNYFGTAPLVTYRINTQDQINPPSSDGMELLDQAITDFTDAANLLPASWDATNIGRANKSAANGYLGKALVFKASWTGDNALYSQAVTAFNKITDKSLTADFNDNFSVNHENNSESLFETQAGQASGSDNVWLQNDDFSVVGSWSAYYGYYNSPFSFWGNPPFIATNKLLNAIDPDDPRMAHIVDPTNRNILKYVQDDQIADTGVGSLNNTRLLRYADVLLLKAEALNETGDQNGAIGLVNEVRTRARNMGSTGVPADYGTGATQDQVRQWIMDERFIELAGEGKRWLDLRRWHKAGFINLANFDFSSDNSSFNISLPKNLLYPIPTGEVDLNKNITQNEGY